MLVIVVLKARQRNENKLVQIFLVHRGTIITDDHVIVI